MSELFQPQVIRFTIFAEAASKANSRRFATVGVAGQPGKTRMRSIKSEKALAFENDALRQIPATARKRLPGPICFTARIYYRTERPDLDESVILDVLQDRYIRVPDPKDRTGKKKIRMLVQHGVYQNDRQVREKHIYHGIDKRNPRVEIEVCELLER